MAAALVPGDPLDAIARAGFPWFEYGATAIGRYLGSGAGDPRFIATGASIIDLARLFEHLEYPALPYADAALIGQAPQGAPAGVRFLCVEGLGADGSRARGLGASPAADFRRNPRNGFYADPGDVRGSLREALLPAPDPAHPNALFETAILLARAGDCPGLPEAAAFRLPVDASALYQRDLLNLILTGSNPGRGFDFLLRTGFVRKFWPDLADLAEVDHAKDHHPEGGGWAHTMETFGHRKTPDLTLSLALLLHDTGKSRSRSESGKRFHRHAELGAGIARGMLGRLGFPQALVGDVEYLVRSHMLPAALPRLPASRMGDVVSDPRFPMLLELYRCDEFSSYKGPGGYHEACAAYKAYLRNTKNPYRNADGRKVQARSLAWLNPSVQRGGE